MKTFKTQIYMNASAEAYCERAFGVRRRAFNWGLYRFLETKKTTGRLPSNYDVIKDYRAEVRTSKDKVFVWIAEQQVSARNAEEVFKDVKAAFAAIRAQNRKRRQNYKPRFKTKKDRNQSFSYYAANTSVFRIESEHMLSFEASKHGRQKVRTAESLNFLRKDDVKLCRMTITRQAGKYYLSLSYEKPNRSRLKCTNPTAKVGIDLGVVINAAAFDGKTFSKESFRTKASLKNQKLAKKAVICSQNGIIHSHRYEKKVLLAEKRYAKAARQRNQELEKYTTFLVRNYGEIVIDDFHFKATLGLCQSEKRDKLYQSMIYQFKLRLEQKAAVSGTKVHYVEHHRGLKTTHICSRCHSTAVVIDRKTRVLRCKTCGLQIDRDMNAAINTFAL